MTRCSFAAGTCAVLLAVSVAGCGDGGSSDGPAAVVETTVATSSATTPTTQPAVTTSSVAVGAIDAAELEQLLTDSEHLADEIDADLAGDERVG